MFLVIIEVLRSECLDFIMWSHCNLSRSHQKRLSDENLGWFSFWLFRKDNITLFSQMSNYLNTLWYFISLILQVFTMLNDTHWDKTQLCFFAVPHLFFPTVLLRLLWRNISPFALPLTHMTPSYTKRKLVLAEGNICLGQSSPSLGQSPNLSLAQPVHL